MGAYTYRGVCRCSHVTLKVYTAATLHSAAYGVTSSVFLECIMYRGCCKHVFCDSATNTRHSNALVNISYSLVLHLGELARASTAAVVPLFVAVQFKSSTTVTQ
jgi:hypothetical protein